MLRIKHFTKLFGDKKVLNNVSLNVEHGEIAVLLGTSGVGKSTVLRILNNLETLDSGSVELDGKPLDLTRVNVGHQVGMVFQNFNLFEHLTVGQNITLALEYVLGYSPAKALNIARTLLSQYGLSEKIDRYVGQLSGGQKQRLALARTLATKPRVVCLDEPTSALDPLLTTYVANEITQLSNQNYIILIATHDTALLEKLDCTIYLLDAGSIIESAGSKEFFANRSAYPLIDTFVQGTI